MPALANRIAPVQLPKSPQTVKTPKKKKSYPGRQYTSRLQENDLTPQQRQELVLGAMGLAGDMTNVWYSRREGWRTDLPPREEMYSAAVWGLCWAARHFDPARGYKFGTYAGPWVRNKLRDEVQRHRSQGFVTTRDEYMELTRESFFNGPRSGVDGFRVAESVEDRLARDDGPNQASLDAAELWGRLRRYVKERDRRVMEMRHGEGLSLREIGRRIDRSPEMVRLILRDAALRLYVVAKRLGEGEEL